jgi:hypothetical protein
MSADIKQRMSRDFMSRAGVGVRSRGDLSDVGGRSMSVGGRSDDGVSWVMLLLSQAAIPLAGRH